MSILNAVTHSAANRAGLRIVLAGVEKVGKTTTACEAPGVLLVPLENGFSGVKVHTTPMLPRNADVMQLMTEIAQQCAARQFPFKTVVMDSVTALERLIHDATLQRDPAYAKGNTKALTMEAALGGYGKAYPYANELFANFLAAVDYIAVNYGINFVLTCHVFTSKVIDPVNGEYDTWDLLLHSPKNSKTYGKREMITQWADMVAFMHEPLYISKGATMSQGVSANKGIVAGLSRTPGYVAGNRFGITGEIPLPKGQAWNAIAHAIYQSCGIDVYNRQA